MLPGIGAHLTKSRWHFERFDDAIGDSIRVEKWDQQTVLAIYDYFADRGRVRTDHHATGAHRLEKRPGENERICKVNMCRRYLKQCMIFRVSQVTDEMQPVWINP